MEAIDRDGSFLDVGCANGYLLESIVRWSERRIEPFGLDFSPRLVELARARLPQWADRIYLGDALEWEPPRRFDFAPSSSTRRRSDGGSSSSGSSNARSRPAGA